MNLYERHVAEVTKNDSDADDGKKRGRIKVKCPGLTGDPDTELPHWVEPTLDWGWFYVPEKGELVEVEAKSHGDQDESIGQSSIADLDIRWRGKRFLSPDASTPLEVPPDFTSNYGKQRGFSTPFGHVLLFDDKEPCVYVTLATKAVESGKSPKASEMTQLKLAKDGSMVVTVLEKTVLTLKAGKYELKLDGGMSLVLEGKDSSAKATVGDGAVKVAIADNMKTWYNSQVKTFLQTHTHPTGMGPSGAPIQPPPNWDSTIESTKVKIPNG